MIVGDINYIHPFREGNGRTQLQYLKQLAEEAGHRLDLARIEGARWIEASIASHAADYGPMAAAILAALKPQSGRALTPLAPPFISLLNRRRARRPSHFQHLKTAAAPGAAHRRTDKMANTSSARKATRVIARRTEVNTARRSRMRTSVRKVEEAINSGDKAAALAALKAAEPEIMRAAQKGVVHRNAANRKVSRLAHGVAKLGK